MPVSNGVTTGPATRGFQAHACLKAIQLYLDHGVQANRLYTPANMRAIATQFTGVQYARSRKGLANAALDLQVLCSKHTLDELGEIHAKRSTDSQS